MHTRLEDIARWQNACVRTPGPQEQTKLIVVQTRGSQTICDGVSLKTERPSWAPPCDLSPALTQPVSCCLLYCFQSSEPVHLPHCRGWEVSLTWWCGDGERAASGGCRRSSRAEVWGNRCGNKHLAGIREGLGLLPPNKLFFQGDFTSGNRTALSGSRAGSGLPYKAPITTQLLLWPAQLRVPQVISSM